MEARLVKLCYILFCFDNASLRNVATIAAGNKDCSLHFRLEDLGKIVVVFPASPYLIARDKYYGVITQ